MKFCQASEIALFFSRRGTNFSFGEIDNGALKMNDERSLETGGLPR
jgi:hypothetical protein